MEQWLVETGVRIMQRLVEIGVMPWLVETYT